MTANAKQYFAIYREENTPTWYQATGVPGFRSEANHRNGVSTLFEASTFGHFRNGEFVGELLTIAMHDHSVEARYTAKALFEYRSTNDIFAIRAHARVAELPIVPIEWRKWVLIQNHALYYTGRENDMNPFLELVSGNQLRLEQRIIIGAEPAPVLQFSNAERPLGRTPVQAMPVPVQSAKITASKSWLDRFFKRN